MRFRFVPFEVVLALQKDLAQQYGGQIGIRDIQLLKSALAQPKATYGGEFLHKTTFDKAAAYGFHLCMNHPFIDGNKRIAFVVIDIFLQRNGRLLHAPEQEAYKMMMELANGQLSKIHLAEWLETHSSKSSASS